MWHNVAWFLAGVGFTIAVEIAIGLYLINTADYYEPGDNN